MLRPRVGNLALVCVVVPLAWAYDVNKDLKNIGTSSAYDVAVVLSGPENVTGQYPGYPGRRFKSFSNGVNGSGNQLLHWQDLDEPGGNGAVDPGEIVHVGWTTSDHSSHVLDMYWTDKQGKRIPGSKIFNITSGWTYETSGFVSVNWNNIFRTEWGQAFPIQIMDVHWAIAPQPWPLAELNGANQELNARLQPLAGGFFTLAPEQSLTLELPVPVPPQTAIVLRYGVMGPGSEADSLDWVQFVVARGRPGDMNCDGAVDFLDINAFVLAISDPAGYAAAYPTCDIQNGDINADGRVDFEDINPFVRLLTGSESAPAESTSAAL